MNPGGLPETAVERLCAIFHDYPAIRRVLLYGSRAMGTYRPGSDIEDLLLPWKVDLSLRHMIDNPDLQEHIERVGVIFYAAD